jgi:hypothetical protein
MGKSFALAFGVGAAAMTLGFVLGRTTSPQSETLVVAPTHSVAPADAEAQSRRSDSTPFSEQRRSHNSGRETPRELVPIVREAVKGGKDDAMASARGHISDYIDHDPQRAMAVLGWFRTETDPAALDVLMAAVSADPDVASNPEVLAAFLQVARDDALSSRRLAAIAFLGQGPSQPPEVDRQLVELVHADADPQIRSAAISALRERVEIDPKAAQRLNPELIELASVQSDPAFRQQALQAVHVRELSEHHIQGMLGFLQDENSAVRITAAEQLGDVRPQHRSEALEALSQTVRFDARSEVRRACLLSMVKVGRSQSLATLRELRDVDPELTQEIDDYVAILASGDLDLERVFDEKKKLEELRSTTSRIASPGASIIPWTR